MEIFGMGPAEILIIMVIALIVFGPGKLPEIGAALGRAVGDFRRAAKDLTGGLQDDLAEVRDEVQGAMKDVQSGVQDTINAAQQEAQSVVAGANALASEAVALPAPVAAAGQTDSDPAADADKKWMQLGNASGNEGAPQA
jgi:TatA/E family protein of Tat protein translocase